MAKSQDKSADKTKADFVNELKAADATIYASVSRRVERDVVVNGETRKIVEIEETRRPLTKAEYDAKISADADMKLSEQAAAKDAATRFSALEKTLSEKTGLTFSDLRFGLSYSPPAE